MGSRNTRYLLQPNRKKHLLQPQSSRNTRYLLQPRSNRKNICCSPNPAEIHDICCSPNRKTHLLQPPSSRNTRYLLQPQSKKTSAAAPTQQKYTIPAAAPIEKHLLQ